MLRSLFALFVVALAGLVAHAEDKRVFELRIYSINPGRQEHVNKIIAGTGKKYMSKYHIDLLGAWVPVDASDERVITLVAHADKASADKNWAALQADEGWKAALAAVDTGEKAVANITRIFMNATDYSALVAPANVGNRIFELRTYITTPNNLGHLNSRFRDHTVKLFEKHGMTNIAYFNILAGEKTTCGEVMKACAVKGKDAVDVKPETPAADLALVYFITHASPEAMKKNFSSFGGDAAWRTALTASEKKAGGPLTAKNGVKSLVLKPTDYSPMK